MKKWIVLSLIIIALLMAMPYGLGVLTQYELNQRQAVINKHFSGSFSSEILQYQRGWFSSNAKVKQSVNVQKFAQNFTALLTPLLSNQGDLQDGWVTLTYDTKISHGPIIISHDAGKTRLQLGLAGLSADCNFVWREQIRYLYQLNSLVHFSGKITTHLQSAKVNVVNKPQDFRMVWDGAHLDAEISRGLDQINLKLAIAPLKAGLISQDTKVDTSAIALTTNLQRGIEDMWFGNMVLTMQSLAIVVKGQSSFALQHVDAVSQQSLQNQKVSTTLKYAIDEIKAHGERYGPSEFNLALHDLTAPYLKVVSEMIHKNNLHTMTKEQLSYFGMQMVPDFLRMLDGSQMQLSFHTTSPQGVINLNVAITAPTQAGKKLDALGFARDAQGSLQMVAPKVIVIALVADKIKEKSTPEFLQKAIKAGAVPNLQDLTEESKKKAQDKLQALVNEGWIMADNENFKMDFHYQNGQIIANGIPKYNLLGQM